MTQTEAKQHPVLNFFNLSDEYERRARFLPAMFSILVLVPVSLAFGVQFLDFVTLIGAGAGIGAILAVGLSHLTSAMGNRYQRSLWPDWPHDAPTHQWLHPSDTSRSQQQKKSWYAAIKAVTGIDIAKAAKSGNTEELNGAINDAVSAVRSRLWKQDGREAQLVRLRNIDYGYARNLTALRPLWLSGALLSCIGSWVAWYWLQSTLLWPVVATIMLVLLPILAAFVLPEYVRQKAVYYAESFFAALELLAFTSDSSPSNS